MALTTKLEAVNTMLSAIGESPVNSLTSGLIEAETAETILNNVSREVQSEGWNFNREKRRPFLPDSAGVIRLPTNILRADATNEQGSRDLVQRGLVMYDKINFTNVIGEKVFLDTVVELDFEYLPEVARRYITIKAARIFQDRVVGSDLLHGFNERDEMSAYFQLKEFEGETEDYSIFDNYTVYAPLDRTIGS